MAIETSMTTHNRLNPCFTPAIIHRVSVPGPIKAAVTKAAGPIENLNFIGDEDTQFTPSTLPYPNCGIEWFRQYVRHGWSRKKRDQQ